MRLIKAFMRFFFYHLYHGFAWAYDLVALTVSLGRWQAWILTTVGFVHGPKVLELGFGPGHLHRALHEKGMFVYGLDESQQMALLATRRLQNHGYQSHLTGGVAQQLPFAAARFDEVIATFPSEYIVDPATRAEIWRVLRPGGKLIVLASAIFGNRDFSERTATWLFRITGQDADKNDLLERLAAPFKETGFETVIEERTTRGSTLFFVIAKKQSGII